MSADPASSPTASTLSLLVARDLHVVLGDVPVLRGVSIQLHVGQSLALVGPNGAGKSTLLRALAGLIRPTRGQITVYGQPLNSGNLDARRQIGLVGHQAMLYPDLTARENLRFYGNLYRLDGLDRRIDEALHALDLAQQADTRVHALSRGMTQRLALSRALLHQPRLLLLDEPDTGLDARAYDALTAAIQAGRDARAMVMATHDLRRVLELADAVAFLRGGRIAETVSTVGRSLGDLQDCYADVLARRPAPRAPVVPDASRRRA